MTRFSLLSCLAFLALFPLSLQSPCTKSTSTAKTTTSTTSRCTTSTSAKLTTSTTTRLTTSTTIKSSTSTTTTARSTSTTPFCQQPLVKDAEILFNLLPNHEGSSLCSSVLHKYQTATVTNTVTGTTTITSVIDEATTLTQQTVTTTVTDVETADVEATTTITQTSYTTVVTLPAVTSLVLTEIVSPVKRSPASQDPTSQLASILHLATSIVSAFCSCEAPGPTSTTTLTQTTSVQVIINPLQTSYTTTVTPAPVVQTSATTVLTTVAVTTTTDVATTTVTVLVAPTPFFLQVDGGNYDGQYIADPFANYLRVSDSTLDAVELYIDPTTNYLMELGTGKLIYPIFQNFFDPGVPTDIAVLRGGSSDEANEFATCAVAPPTDVTDPRGTLTCTIPPVQAGDPSFNMFAIANLVNFDGSDFDGYPVFATPQSQQPSNLSTLASVLLRTIFELPAVIPSV